MPSPEARVGPRPELPRCSKMVRMGVLLECTPTYRSANMIVNTFECTYANANVFSISELTVVRYWSLESRAQRPQGRLPGRRQEPCPNGH
jgi:hypothetical protein